MKKLLIALLLLPSLAWGGENMEIARMNPYILGGGVSAAAATPDWSDGFESGDATGWSGGENTDADANLSVGSGNAHTGTYGLIYQMDTTKNAVVLEDGGVYLNNEREGYIVFYIKLNDVTAVAVTGNYNYRPVRLYSNAHDTQFDIVLRSGNSPYDLKRIGVETSAYYQSDELTWAADTWYKITMYFKYETGATAADGIVKLWRDTSLVIDQTAVENYERTGVGAIAAGNVNTHDWKTDQGIYVYMDDFAYYSGVAP